MRWSDGMADMQHSKCCGRKPVRVRISPPALDKIINKIYKNCGPLIRRFNMPFGGSFYPPAFDLVKSKFMWWIDIALAFFICVIWSIAILAICFGVLLSTGFPTWASFTVSVVIGSIIARQIFQKWFFQDYLQERLRIYKSLRTWPWSAR